MSTLIISIGTISSLVTTIIAIVYYYTVIEPGRKKLAKDSVGRRLLIKIDGSYEDCEVNQYSGKLIKVSYGESYPQKTRWIKFNVYKIVSVL